MFKTNTYFDNNVISIGYSNDEGNATLGVMAAGEYTFSTNSKEYMTVISGEMNVLLPNSIEWVTYKALETFTIEANESFQVKVNQDTPYKCIYK